MTLPRELVELLAADGFTGENEEGYQGLRMRVFGEQAATEYIPGLDEVCISISGRGVETSPVSIDFVDVLNVVFDDVSRFAVSQYGAAGLQSLSGDQADSVIRFVEAHLGRRRLVLHCRAGISRSRSMAAAIARLYNLPYRWTCLNMEVVRAIEAAFTRRK